MSTITLYRPSVEYIKFEINSDVDLDGAIQISFDRIHWLDAEWEGSVGVTRTARYLLDTSDKDSLYIKCGGNSNTVYVKLVDLPESSVFPVGTLIIL